MHKFSGFFRKPQKTERIFLFRIECWSLRIHTWHPSWYLPKYWPFRSSLSILKLIPCNKYSEPQKMHPNLLQLSFLLLKNTLDSPLNVGPGAYSGRVLGVKLLPFWDFFSIYQDFLRKITKTPLNYPFHTKKIKIPLKNF